MESCNRPNEFTSAVIVLIYQVSQVEVCYDRK